MTPPLVTALVAVYNEERHLAQCLSSLERQSYTPLEIVVADDGSNDRTRAIAARFPVRLLAGPHQGKAKTVNAAAAAARGEVVLFLDGDMWFEPDYVARLVEPILQGGETGTCHGTELVANSANPWARCWQNKAGLPPDRRLVLDESQCAEGSPIFRAVRRNAFLEVGGFDDTGYADDQTLAPKLGCRAAWIPRAVCHHHNPETLGEVFAAGVWGGKSAQLPKGVISLIGLLPPVSTIRGLREAARLQNPAVVLYDTVFAAGVAWGAAQFRLGLDRTRGR